LGQTHEVSSDDDKEKRMLMKKGLFVTFEGMEGSGKTTAIQAVADFLTEAGHSVCVTREPGGTPMGKEIRSWLLNPGSVLHDPRSELLLFAADRLEHIAGVIRPALSRGEVVLCDRFTDSTLAYQVGGRGLDADLVAYGIGLAGLVPDLTFLMDVSPEEGLRRAGKRGALDRFEKEDLTFHHRVRDTYLAIAKRESRVHVVDTEGMGPGDCVERVLGVVDSFLSVV
jgi:dTMP kinase